jgi:ABC-type branched-subunit amino acid transport system substrate-binding protein
VSRLRRLAGGTAAIVLAATLAGCGSSGSSTGSSDGPDAADAAKSPDFGTMKNVCHSATGANRPGAHGVGADSIKVTTISDAGSDLQPGLNQELWDAATVFTRWCNDHGGIDGRRIVMIKGDAQVTRYSDVIDQACKSSFALVGGGGALDNTGQKARVDCGLVALPGFVASPEARGAPLSYPAMATGITGVTGGGLKYLKKKYGADEPLATVYGDFATTTFTMDQRLSAAKGVGLASAASPVNHENNTYPITGLTDARPVADSVLQSDARGVLFSGQPPDLGKFISTLAAKGAGAADKSLEWAFTDENMYDQLLIQSGRTGLAELPLYVQTFIYPFEEAGRGERSEAMDDFLALFDEYLPNGKSHAMFAVAGFASWLLFAKTASACGANLTRACLESQLKKVGTFDAGGLIAPRDPSDPNQSSQCFVLLRATPDGFVRVKDPTLAPTPGIGRGVFNCGKDNIITVSDSPLMKKWQDQVAAMFGTDPQG